MSLLIRTFEERNMRILVRTNFRLFPRLVPDAFCSVVSVILKPIAFMAHAQAAALWREAIVIGLV